MNGDEWHTWCYDVVGRITKIEKTLTKYHNIQKRMLWINAMMILGVIGLNGLLLFYK